ncbi:transglutaminase domain-containing protein [Blautia glucerasea]|uniref:transglutaminase domain-containing protein n=1 Tax=Blautia glucerasea TaxID=536633 RepID=UPI001D020298|nr:transglutaminase domain-containing protein [Blautia glucerasea]MCB5387496.1 transglutaminase domain-containing protein [Blautia glucerasea]MCB5422314.1 transglutaminase domain-containing protein [Blautia luti]
MFLQNSQKKIEEEFLKLTEKLGADREPLKTICEKLDGCGRDLGLAMKYLYVTAPYSDLVNYSFEDIQDFAGHGLFLYNTLERVKELPEEMFLNYILDHRVNEEEVLPCRTLFWNELKDRIEGKNAKDAAIEVNYWCAEEATYHSGDDRTLPALTVYRRGYGRCGEESVFLVNALRSVGIPARQVYVPRWSHCDDNHAWVELWCDGKWYFTGACEPLMILNKGWFTNASSRAMMVHSRLFDLFPAEGEDVIGKEGAAVMLNQTARYAKVKTVSVKVLDKTGAPVKGAQVQFQVLNMGEYFPIAKAETDENGTVSLVTGLGSVRVLAFLPGMEGFAQADLDTRALGEISLTLTGEAVEAEDWRAVDVIAPVDTPVNPDMPTPEQKAEGTRRMNEANKIRKEKKENWVNPELTAFLAGEDEKELRQAMVDVLSEKDHTDCVCNVLEEHLEYGKVYAKEYRDLVLNANGYNLYINYVLNPRVEDELLRPYRKEILSFFTDEQKAAFRVNPAEIWNYIQTHIVAYPDNERETVMETPYECLVSGIGTQRSQKVLFVAIARTLGIPARLNPDNKVMEYWAMDHFVPVLKQQEGGAVLILKKEADAVWNYYQNWTMGRLVGNEYVSLNLTGRSWEGDTLELALILGTYRIITTNRLPNGNQFAWEKTFIIKEGEKLEETLHLREAQLGDMLERISLPEFKVKDADGNQVTCADLTKGGKKILMWLEESQEPTEHILNEMLEHAEKFHKFENSISFMIRTQEAKQDPLLAKVLKIFPNVSVYYDSFEENIELLGRRMYVDPDKLPLILVTNGESVGIYATSGYNVGTGDMLIRIMEEVPEVQV